MPLLLLLAAGTAPAVVAAQISLTTSYEKRIEITAPGPEQGKYLAAIEAVEARLVKDKPFSARAQAESVRTLADGTRIVRKSEARLWRDREGRTRREFEPAATGGAPSGEPSPATIVLHDPLAGAVWLLDPAEKLARKIRVKTEGSVASHAGEQGGGEIVFPAPAMTVWREQRVEGRAPLQFGAVFGGGRLLRFGPDARQQDLGERTIEGLTARGVRFTETIPAGRIGNDRPITIVHEQWVVPELDLLVLAETRDPLSGDVTYRVSEIRRDDPPAGLFEVPADYRIEEAGEIQRRFRLVEEVQKKER